MWLDCGRLPSNRPEKRKEEGNDKESAREADETDEEEDEVDDEENGTSDGTQWEKRVACVTDLDNITDVPLSSTADWSNQPSFVSLVLGRVSPPP